MKHLISLAIMIALITVVFSCKKEKIKPEPEGDSKVETYVVDARAYENWVYFSFDENKEVTIEDFKNSLDWDIAFHRFDVRVNCGTSGIGKGGSISMGKKDFETVEIAPTTGYSLNDSISIVNKPGGWQDQVTVPGDTVMAKWLHFTGPPPQYNITNEIYVVKTAKGKYVKVWLKDYYNDNSETGYITMQYFYQKDGSTNLKE
ncbi:MAG: hypothetical protein CSA36_07390 [Draconibacterium sp.]|nr:MAG: hypothetical protein CSA36_07390 [Draconibacterium sp.]